MKNQMKCKGVQKNLSDVNELERLNNGVLVRRDHKKSAHPARILKKRALVFMAALGLSHRELSITLTGDEEIAEINGQWRQKPVPTDVLSFPAAPMPPVPDLRLPVGDIIISLDTTYRRCAENHVSIASEVSRYLAHGLLHLLGRDHQTPEEARAMLAEEEALLGTLGKAMLTDSEELE